MGMSSKCNIHFVLLAIVYHAIWLCVYYIIIYILSSAIIEKFPNQNSFERSKSSQLEVFN